MKTIGVTCVLLLACGGSDNSGIPDGGGDATTDGTPGDSASSDTGTNDTGTNDAGNDSAPTDAAADSGGFNPGSVMGLVLWLEGDVSSSITTMTSDAGVAFITKWADQTSHHNDANGVPGNPSAQPHGEDGWDQLARRRPLRPAAASCSRATCSPSTTTRTRASSGARVTSSWPRWATSTTPSPR